jgi:hypothetical protein
MNIDTCTSPGIGPAGEDQLLPDGFANYGGFVVDILGANNKRLTAQVSPAGLFEGMILTSEYFKKIITLSSAAFDSTLSRLGGSIKKCNIRVSLCDGDSGSPNPIYSSVFYDQVEGDRMPYCGVNAISPGGAGYLMNVPPQPTGFDFDAGQDMYVAIDLGNGTYINCGIMGTTKTFLLDSAGNTDYYWRDRVGKPGAGAHDRSFTGFPGQFAIAVGDSVVYGPSYVWVMTPTPHQVPNPTLALFNARTAALPLKYKNFSAVTGWFSVPTAQLAALATLLKTNGHMDIGIHDVDPGDQYLNFSLGVAGNIDSIPLFPPAVTSFTATPAVGTTPGTLAWTTDNCTSVTIDHGVGVQPANGSIPVVVGAPTTFMITGTGTDPGAPTALATMAWTLPGIVIASFTASPSALSAPGHTTLSWSVQNAYDISITGPRGFSASGLGAISSLSNVDVEVVGTDTYTLTASHSGTATVVATATVSLTAPPLAIVSVGPLPGADPITPYLGFQFVGSGGFGSYTWSATGVPSWLQLTTGGLLQQRPGFTPPAGTLPQTFTITVTLAEDTLTSPAPQAFSLAFTWLDLGIITTQTDMDNNPAREHVAYQFQFRSQPNINPTWSVDPSQLPPGLTLSATGVLSGTPVTYGYWRFTVQVAMPGAAPATKSLELMVQFGWDRLDPFHEIFYRVYNQDNTPFLVDGKQLCNDPFPALGGEEVFAQLVVAFEVGTNDFTITDVRTNGGGLSPQFQTIEEARNFFDLGYWDGKPYPIGGGLVIQLPKSLLDRMSRAEVQAKINAILPLGTLPVIRYYDNTGVESV